MELTFYHYNFIVLLIIANLACRTFLKRFFLWFQDSKGRHLKFNKYFNFMMIILFIPPFSIIVAVFLITLGIVLQLLRINTK
jgi:hypothetical protein